MQLSGEMSSIRDKGIVILFVLLVLVTSVFSAEWSKWVQSIVLIFTFLFSFLLLRQYSVLAPAISGRSIFRHPHTYLVGWVLIGGLGIMFSGNWYASASYWLLILAYVLLYFSANIFFRKWQLIQWLTYGMLAVGITGAAAGFYLYLNQSDGRLSGLLFNANAISSFFIILIPVALVVWMQAVTRKAKVLWGIGLLFLLVALVLTFSYTAWVSLFVPAYLLVRRYRQQLLNRTVLIVISIMAVVGFGVLIGFRYGHSRDWGEAVKIHQTISYTHFISSFSQRWYFNVSAARMAVDHPLIGSGLGTYQDLYARYAETVFEQPRYAHNYYLQAFAEIGVFGAGSLIAFIILIARSVIQTIRQEIDERRRGILIGLALGALASAIHALFDFGWHSGVVFIMFWLMLGAITGWKQRQSPAAPQQVAPSSSGHFLSGVISSGALLIACIVLGRGLTVFIGAYSFDMADRQALRGEFESAFASYEQGLRFDPDPTIFTNYVGLLTANAPLMSAEKKVEVESRLISLTRRQPENYRGFWMLGRLYISEQKFDQAIEPLEQATTLNPLFFPDIYYDLAYAYYSLEQYPAAASAARTMIDVYYPGIQTTNIYLPSQLAAIHFLLGEIARAEGLNLRAAYYYGLSLYNDSSFQPAAAALQSLSGNL